MKITANRCASRAFTFWELLAVVGAISLLVFLLLPAMMGAKAPASRVHCNNNLKMIALSFKMYAGDCDNRFPQFEDSNSGFTGQSSTNLPAPVWKYFCALSNELGIAKILVCPQDVLRVTNFATGFSDGSDGLGNSNKQNAAVSYFIGLNAVETKPNALLVGDRNLASALNADLYRSTKEAAVVVPTNAVWHSTSQEPFHKNEGFYALADGSVQRASNADLKEALRVSRQSYGTNINRFLFPQ